VKNKLSSSAGFTLIEILIALFIFSVLSVILMGALRNVIDSEARAERKAEIFRSVQFACLMISRDLAQIVNRPVLNGSDKEEPAFIGTPHQIMLTHAGFANLNSNEAKSSLVRSGYVWKDDELWRLTFEVLDQAPNSRPHFRKLLTDVTSARFQYLTETGKFVDNWPAKGDSNQSASLPKAVSIEFNLKGLGSIKEFYVVPIKVQKNEKPQPPPGT
jgi:general secretion pathway protein J